MKSSGCICPICGQYVFDQAYEICGVCFWENDPLQHDDHYLSDGANNLCLSDYKKRWNKFKMIMPPLMKKYNVTASHLSHWAYDEMVVSRKNIKEFVNELSENNIRIQLSFYSICEKYGFDNDTFVGYPLNSARTIKESNDESLNIVFSDNPMEICKRYRLTQLIDILSRSKNQLDTWTMMTPYVCLESNPKEL